MFFNTYEKLDSARIQRERNKYLIDFETYKKMFKVTDLTEEEFLSKPVLEKKQILEKMYMISKAEKDELEIIKIFLRASEQDKYIALAELLDKFRKNELRDKELYIEKGLLLCQKFPELFGINSELPVNKEKFKTTISTTNSKYRQIKRKSKKYEKNTFKAIEKFEDAKVFYNTSYEFLIKLDKFLEMYNAQFLLDEPSKIDEWVHKNQDIFEGFLRRNIVLGEAEHKYSRSLR